MNEKTMNVDFTMGTVDHLREEFVKADHVAICKNDEAKMGYKLFFREEFRLFVDKDKSGKTKQKNIRVLILVDFEDLKMENPQTNPATEIVVPGQVGEMAVVQIGFNAFGHNNGAYIRKIILPNTIVKIDDEAFHQCYNLEEVLIPNSVDEIGSRVFSSCVRLTNMFIPKSVTSIGKSIFSNCENLSSIIVDSENPVYDSRNFCNAIVFTANNTMIAGCHSTTIPNTVAEIQGAFDHLGSIKEIKLPSSLRIIGEDAFKNCTYLKRIVIPDSVIKIGEKAFSHCEKLLEIDLPNSVKEIGQSAFANCENLTEIIIPNSITKIEDRTFEYCNSLERVIIPNSVVEIGNNAFDCCNLSQICIPNSVKTIGERAFSYCRRIAEISIPESVSKIGKEAFDCGDITTIKVDENNTTYDSRDGCNAIIETDTNTLIQGCVNSVIPNTITEIGCSAFQNCHCVFSIVLPASVKVINDNAFQFCEELEEIVVPKTVVRIGNYAFCESGLRSIEIPNSVMSIGVGAFENCTNLQKIFIDDATLLYGANVPEETKIVKTDSLIKKEDILDISIIDNIASIVSDNETAQVALTTPNGYTVFDKETGFRDAIKNVVSSNEFFSEYKHVITLFFDAAIDVIKNNVDFLNPNKSIGAVFFDWMNSHIRYFYTLRRLYPLRFIRFINIFNKVEKQQFGNIEFYADFIHSANGTKRLAKDKELFTSEKELIDLGSNNNLFGPNAMTIEELYQMNGEVKKIFEYCSSYTSPLLAQECFALKYNNKYKYIYDEYLMGLVFKNDDSEQQSEQQIEQRFNNWLESIDTCYDANNNGVTNFFFIVGSPWKNNSLYDELDQYVLRGSIGIDRNREEDKEYIIYFLREFQRFLDQLSFYLIVGIKNIQLHQTAIVASFAQVMARNMSHNIGSHVFSNLIGNDAYSKLTDKNILKAKVYVSPWDTEMEYPNGQVPFIKSHSGNFQLSYFNQYLKSRMDYLSEVTFGTPNMLTTKYIYSDVFKELDRVRILLNYISGIQGFKYTFCLKRNGVVLKNENDIAIAFPSDMLGNQAFYNIIENVIRNTAKHACNNKREVVTFTIEFTDIEDCSEYYCVEIDSGIEELDIDELVKKQNIRINTSVLDKDNNLRSHSLGLLEMEASAAFLRQVDIAKVDSYEYHFEDMDEYKNKYNNLILLKAINKNGALGYRFFVQKPKELLLVGNFDVADSKKDAVGKEGVLFISEDDFARAMGEGKSFAHPFLLYPNNVSDKIKILLSDDNDCKTLLPIRKLGLAQDEINEVVAIINGKGNIIPQLKEFAWKKHMQSMGIESGDIYIGEVVGRKRFSNCRQVVFANHGKNFETYWNNRTELPELWVDSLSSYRQGKLPSFACYSLAEDNTEEPLTKYVNTIPAQLKMEIFEAYHNKVVALDERIQRFSLESYEGSICASTLFNATNVIIPKTKLDPEQFDESMIHELEIFINNEINEINGAFLLVHYGILERMYKTEKAITEHLEAWAKKAKRVVVTSGRGSHSLQLPASVCFANLSSVLNAFTESRCKFLINSLINQSRRKNE